MKNTSLRLALYQPDIPQNTGTLMRLCACLGMAMDIIEPCGFALSDRNLARAGMDYRAGLDLTRHVDWAAFQASHAGARRVLLTTQATDIYTEFRFNHTDILLLGRESAGVPPEVHGAVDARISIPMAVGMRSLNVAIAAGMVLGEALRQNGIFAKTEQAA